MKPDLEPFIGQRIVLDTASSWVYLGRLEKVTDHCAVLSEADAHDITDTDASKEYYLFDAKTTGIKANRDRVHVSLAAVVSFSLVDAVKAF